METRISGTGSVGPPDQAARPEPSQRGGDRVLGRTATLEKAGIGKTLMYELLEANDFPKPRALGGRRIGWLECEIDDWIATRKIAEREARGKGREIAA